jgi:pectate lyase
MRVSKNAGTIALAVSLLAATAALSRGDHRRDLGRETLSANDGWAAFSTGTTGGAAAAPEQVYVVTNRRELVAALNNGVYPPPSSTPSNVPKIIYVDGTIDANVDDENGPLACEDYYRNGYTTSGFLATYDPAVWGRVNPSGPMEAARLASQAAQQARVRIRVGSNTTIVGVDRKATIRGAWLDIRGTANVAGSRTNIIIRNLNFEDTYDCFPQWSPTDGAEGNWNALYDSVSLRDTDHVWIDHNTFRDVETADQTLPVYFGRIFQVHDGLLDITNASDLVTVSWNEFRDHDKMMLIGSSDGAVADRGKLRVTLHHNRFDGIGQRAPRVRFGQVHVYNNYYRIEETPNYGYSWGVGVESAIYAENNAFKTDDAVTPDQVIERFNGTRLQESGTLWNGSSHRHALSLLEAYNAANDPDLIPDAGWTPTLFTHVDRTKDVRPAVQGHAGPFNWSDGGHGDDDDDDDDGDD